MRRPGHLRNAVRRVIMPTLESVFPHPQATLARAAAHQAEAARLADDLAAHDAEARCDGTTLDRAALAALPPHRARNLLRWFLRQQALPAPSAARLGAMLAQLGSDRGDANVRLAHGGVELGVHRGRIAIHAKRADAFDLPWSGEAELALPHGRLAFVRAEGEGLDALRLREAPVHVRSRSGGERLQLAPNRPRRALKSILQDAAIPAWERQALPLVFCGGMPRRRRRRGRRCRIPRAAWPCGNQAGMEPRSALTRRASIRPHPTLSRGREREEDGAT